MLSPEPQEPGGVRGPPGALGRRRGLACAQTSPSQVQRAGESCAMAIARWPGARAAGLSCQGKEAAGRRARSSSHSASSRLQRLSCPPVLWRVPSLPPRGLAGLPASPAAVRSEASSLHFPRPLHTTRSLGRVSIAEAGPRHPDGGRMLEKQSEVCGPKG